MSFKEQQTGSRKKMLRGTLIVGIGTLFSRVLGMLRDTATAAILGMSVGGIMDSFVMAFRLPDAARRLFGDGTLGISFIPVFAKVWHQNYKKAWTLLSVVLAKVFFYLTGFVILGEILCLIGVLYFPPESKVHLTAHLLSLLLPYLILICMAAIASAALQARGSFAVSTMIPPILNIAWLFGILVIAPSLSRKPEVQCSILTFCILVAGLFQLLLHYPFLRKNGFRFDFDFQKVQGEIRQIFKDFFPQVFGLMPMQLNVISASVIAWLFAGKQGTTIHWLNHLIEFPLRTGSASAIYYSERLYEFPQGLIGLAVATAIYPFLSHYAAQKNYTALGEELTLGLRIQFCFAIPAGIGLMLMSEKLTHLLFQRGSFTADDMMRTADMVFWFGTSIWAFCSLPILIRAFYILGDVQTPFRFGLLSCVLNILLGIFLIFPMQEQGLAVAVSFSAGIHAATLFCLFAVKHGYIHFKALLFCIVRSIVATCFMAVAVAIVMKTLPGRSSLDDILHIVLGGVIGFFVYFIVYRSLGGRELGILIRGRVRRNKRWK